MLDENGVWQGYGFGDMDDDTLPRNHPNWSAVRLLNEKLHAKFQWARDMGVVSSPHYTAITAQAVAEFQRRAGLPVLLSNKPPEQEGGPLEPPYGIANLATRARLGSYPPPPPPRHACLTFSGTWAPPGVGYPSDVARACADLVEEIPVQSPWSFGPVPPGAIDSLSYQQSVYVAVQWAIGWILDHPERTVILVGYSQGAEAASRVRAEYEPGGRLAHLRSKLVAGITFGNPCRPANRTFYGDPQPTSGAGISNFRLDPRILDWSWIDLANAGDIYTSTPEPGSPSAGAGLIMRDAYELAIKLQLNDFMKFAGDFGDSVWRLVQDAQNDIPGALDAAGRGLAFIMQNPPTRPHISYEWDEAKPGITHLNLAIQHCRDWSGRVTPGDKTLSVAA